VPRTIGSACTASTGPVRSVLLGVEPIESLLPAGLGTTEVAGLGKTGAGLAIAAELEVGAA
jgi:hypothetical protein